MALVDFKIHSQARAFLQPTRANIHQYQFNNPKILRFDANYRFIISILRVFFITDYKAFNLLLGIFVYGQKGRRHCKHYSNFIHQNA